jgi:hypothetical protein
VPQFGASGSIEAQGRVDTSSGNGNDLTRLIKGA